jgi:phage/plasmid-associated DNA primase
MFCQKANERESANAATPNMNHLDSARMVLISETPPGYRLNWDLIKTISSGEHLLVRGLYQEPREIQLQAKLVVGTNHLPELNASDQAVVDRFRLLNFECRYVDVPLHDGELQKNPLEEMKLRSMCDAFGTWCVSGARKMYSESPPRVAVPVLLQAQIDEAVEEADVVAAFLNEEGELGSDKRWVQHDMYLQFRQWAMARGSPKAETTPSAFVEDVSMRFSHKGIRVYTVPGQRATFLGVGPRPYADVSEIL